jgi:dihydrofolate synthase/folylpolyglutamate synthase
MAPSDAILTRLLQLHPKVIDLSLERMRRILDRLGRPERLLPPVIHVAGTNGKGSTCAFLQAILEAAGLKVHVYTSPHLVRFHERIRLADAAGESRPIDEHLLQRLLEECEVANGSHPITFFEITTAAALLAFSRLPADYLVLEVGLGGRLDATNVVDRPKLTAITMIDYDHQHYLGSTLSEIAREKAGILKRDVPCVVGRQPEEARDEIERCAQAIGAPLLASGSDWMSFEQNGRLIFQDEEALMDLPRPRLPGAFQIENAGIAVAALRALKDRRLDERHFALGLGRASWPARMQRLAEGELTRSLEPGSELWLDGGHNPAAGRAVAQAFAELEERCSKPLVLILGMLRTKDAAGYIRPFKGLAQKVFTIAIPGEPNSFGANELAQIVEGEGMAAMPSPSVAAALARAQKAGAPLRILIAGSLYLAGSVLAEHSGEAMSKVSGTAR